MLSAGLLLTAAGGVLYAQMPADGHYFWNVFPGLLVSGIGLGLPEEYGGRGANAVSFGAYVEELAKVSSTASLMAAYASSFSFSSR